MSAPGAPLALGPGTRARPRNVLNLTVLMVVTGGLVLFAALIGAYAAVNRGSGTWPPKGVSLDNYVGTMLSLTAIMSAVTVEWACYAVKRDDPAQAAWGLGATLGLGLAFLNLLWFLGRNVHFGPGSTAVGPYAGLFFAMITAAGAVAVLGAAALAMALARTLGGQMTSSHREVVRAVAWYWDFVVVAWIAVYATLWLFT
jgi:cytochrome c oxidase subunit 3